VASGFYSWYQGERHFCNAFCKAAPSALLVGHQRTNGSRSISKHLLHTEKAPQANSYARFCAADKNAQTYGTQLNITAMGVTPTTIQDCLNICDDDTK